MPDGFTDEEVAIGDQLHEKTCGCSRGATWVWYDMARRWLEARNVHPTPIENEEIKNGRIHP